MLKSPYQINFHAHQLSDFNDRIQDASARIHWADFLDLPSSVDGFPPREMGRQEIPSGPHFASIQFGPTPVSTSSGTLS